MPRRRTPFALAASAALLVLSAPLGHFASASEVAEITRAAAESRTRAEGENKLAQRIATEAAGDEARFGLALLQFTDAVEAFGRHHYRHGLKAPAFAQVPFLRMPVPANPHPDALTYPAQRAALQRFLDALHATERTLAGIKDGAAMKIVIDLEKVRLDFSGSGTDDTGTNDTGTTLMEVVRDITRAGAAPVPNAGPAPPFEVAFDMGDALWLRGYCHLLSAGLEFLLAYDWSGTFATAGDLFYPRIEAGVAGANSPAAATQWSRDGSREIAAAIAMIHLMRWEPVEPQRLKAVRHHLKQVVALSRQSWAAILAETDDDREWIPSPTQKNGVLPEMGVTQERVKTWLAALDAFDDALDGRKLIPHWALAKGINVKRLLDEPGTFDLVLWTTGHGLRPYLEDGATISPQDWALWQRVFEGNFFGFALYFN